MGLVYPATNKVDTAALTVLSQQLAQNQRAAFRLGIARQRDAETRAIANVAGRHADGLAGVAFALVRVPPRDGNSARRGGAVLERLVFARNHGAGRLDMEFDESDGAAADARHGRGLYASSSNWPCAGMAAISSRSGVPWVGR